MGDHKLPTYNELCDLYGCRRNDDGSFINNTPKRSPSSVRAETGAEGWVFGRSLSFRSAESYARWAGERPQRTLRRSGRAQQGFRC